MIKKLLTSVSADKRVLVLLIGWSFGGFMEAMAGFGTAVAIPASMLWVLDFDPILACSCLFSCQFNTNTIWVNCYSYSNTCNKLRFRK